MKLTVTKKGEQAAVEQQKADKSRKGRTSRNKGATYERDIAKRFKSALDTEFVRTPQSGGFAKNNAKAGDFRGDIVTADEDVDCTLHVECKNAKSWSLPAWLRQSREDCPEGKTPCVIFHQHGTSEDFIALSLDDFLKLVPKSKLIVRKK